MENTGEVKIKFGLVGKNISYSFSKGYFAQKFSNLQLNDHSYENFDLSEISEFKELLNTHPCLKGLNVTIPYKEEVIPYLDSLDPEAQKIGAVNTIKIDGNGLKGYNTDAYGFQKSLEPFLLPHHRQALILGTGGASKAVAHVLDTLNISYAFVSRKPGRGRYTYDDLTERVMEAHTIIINCTPLGTHPNITVKPNIPYTYLNHKHLLYDLIYNPEKTAFLVLGESQGAAITNGLRMLQLQAEKAWQIWSE